MLPHERAALVLVALEAGLVDVLQRRGGPGPDIRRVDLMTVGAAHLPFHERVMVGQAELGLLVEVAGKTGARIFPRIDDPAHPAAAAGGDMEATRPMAHLAALGLGLWHRDARVRGLLEFLVLFRVTGGTGLRADVLGLSGFGRRLMGVVARGRGRLGRPRRRTGKRREVRLQPVNDIGRAGGRLFPVAGLRGWCAGRGGLCNRRSLRGCAAGWRDRAGRRGGGIRRVGPGFHFLKRGGAIPVGIRGFGGAHVFHGELLRVRRRRQLLEGVAVAVQLVLLPDRP